MFSHYLHCYENLQYLLYTKMDDEIIKTSHENITHLAANTLYFLQNFVCLEEKYFEFLHRPASVI